MESSLNFIYGLSLLSTILLEIPSAASSASSQRQKKGREPKNYYYESHPEGVPYYHHHLRDKYNHQVYSRYGHDYYGDDEDDLEPGPLEREQRNEEGDGYSDDYGYEGQSEPHEDEKFGYGDEGYEHDSYRDKGYEDEGYEVRGGYEDGGFEGGGGYEDGDYEGGAYEGEAYEGEAEGGAYDTTKAPDIATVKPMTAFVNSEFKTQTGFKETMVVNKMTKLMPWGIDGVIIIIAAIIVFAIVIIAIVGLIAWFVGIRKVHKDFINDKEILTKWREAWSQNLENISTNVFTAIDKFDNQEINIDLTE